MRGVLEMSSMAALGFLSPEEITKVYCPCGCIVDLDKNTIKLKLNLGKSIECMRCRNNRISAEIEMMERHFSGNSDEEPDWLL